MTKHPELDKLAKVSEESNKIGAFLDWLSSEGFKIATEHAHTEKCEPDSRFDEIWKCGFTRDGGLEQSFLNIETLLAKYYDIDLNKVEKERRAILEEIRKKQ